MNRDLRVLQVVLSLNPGGTERLVVEMVQRLHAEVPMAVCCLDDHGAWGHELGASGIEVTSLRRSEGFHPLLGRVVARAAEHHRAAVIHCHHYSPFVYACLARIWRPASKVIYTEHGRLSDALPSTKRRVANQVLCRLPHEVFAVSEDLKRHMVAEGFSSAQVRVLHNGIPVGPLPDARTRACARQKLGIADETFVVGTVARLDPVKDLDVLMAATATIAPRVPTALLVIGDGAERKRLENAAGPHVRFLGHRDDVQGLLAGCDAYANSSIHEGVSLTILEAMAAGLPVVATRVGGTPEILDAACGRLVPARDPAAMADALLDLALNPPLRETLGAEARRRVEARFTIERMVSQYRDAYIRVAA